MLAQTTIDTGSIVGTVSGPSGAVIRGATVSIRNVATGQSVDLETNSAGTFSSGALIPGNYAIRISFIGFDSAKVLALVRLGNTTTVNAILPIAGTGRPSRCKDIREQPSVQGVLNEQQIDNLPVNGRNFLELAQLEPGVQIQDAATFGFGFKDGYSSVSFGGRFGRTARIEVDSIDISDERFGSSILATLLTGY